MPNSASTAATTSIPQRQNTFGNFADTAGTQSSLSQYVTLGLSHNWTPHVVESTQLNWSRSRTKILSDNSFTNDVAGDLGIDGVSTDPLTFGIPAIRFTSFSGLNDPVPSLVRNQTLRFADSVNWVRGKHTFTFGGEIRRIQLNTDAESAAARPIQFYRRDDLATHRHRPARPAPLRSPSLTTSSPIFFSACPTAPPCNSAPTSIFAAGISSPTHKTTGA